MGSLALEETLTATTEWELEHINFVKVLAKSSQNGTYAEQPPTSKGPHSLNPLSFPLSVVLSSLPLPFFSSPPNHMQNILLFYYFS